MAGKDAKKAPSKSKSSEKVTVFVTYEKPEKPTLTSTFTWGNNYCVTEVTTLEKNPRKIREKETNYE